MSARRKLLNAETKSKPGALRVLQQRKKGDWRGDLKGAAFEVAFYLAGEMRYPGFYVGWQSPKKIADDTGLNRRTVERALTILEDERRPLIIREWIEYADLAAEAERKGCPAHYVKKLRSIALKHRNSDVKPLVRAKRLIASPEKFLAARARAQEQLAKGSGRAHARKVQRQVNRMREPA